MTRIIAHRVLIARVGLGLWCLYFFLGMARSLGGLPLVAELNFGLSPEFFRLLGWLGAAAALCFLMGYAARVSAWGTLLIMQAFLQLLPRIREVSYPYLSMMLIVFALYYESEGGFSARLRRREVWYLPLLFATYGGLFISGISKTLSGLWRSGEAFSLLCPASPVTHWLGPVVCDHVSPALACGAAAGIEVAAFPLVLFRRTRTTAWWMVTLLHVGIFFEVSVWPVSLGMLLMQVFLLDDPRANDSRRIFRGAP